MKRNLVLLLNRYKNWLTEVFKLISILFEYLFLQIIFCIINVFLSACEKLSLSGSIKVVLEQDGTEIDEEDYFSTLDKNTTLMLLPADLNWSPPGRK